MAVTHKRPLKVYIEADQDDRLEEMARREDRTKTSLVRRFIAEGLENNGSAAPSPEKRSRAVRRKEV